MVFNAKDYVTFAQAARLRREADLPGTSRQWIRDLVERGKLKTLDIAGERFVKKSDVLNYRGLKGRPRKKPTKISPK